MNKILSTLLIAAALSSSAAFAEDTLRVSMENGKQRVDFSSQRQRQVRHGRRQDPLRADAGYSDSGGFLRIELNTISSRSDFCRAMVPGFFWLEGRLAIFVVRRAPPGEKTLRPRPPGLAPTQ